MSQGRRFVVALVVTTAAAAVTAGVVFKDRRPGEAVVQRAVAAPLLGADRVGAAAGRRAPLSETASTSIVELPDDAAAMHWDPSLPAASKALEGGPDAPDNAAPTF
jgi:hypothetical protein